MKTWMKSVVRDTSSAWGLKTRRPPATILIPGSLGVARSRSMGKSRTIGEFRSSSFGQVSLAKGDNLHLIQLFLITCCWQELLSQHQGILPKRKTPRQRWSPGAKQTLCFFPWWYIWLILLSQTPRHASATYHKMRNLNPFTKSVLKDQQDWIFLQTNWSLSVTQLLIISWDQEIWFFQSSWDFRRFRWVWLTNQVWLKDKSSFGGCFQS